MAIISYFLHKLRTLTWKTQTRKRSSMLLTRFVCVNFSLSRDYVINRILQPIDQDWPSLRFILNYAF